MFRRPTVYLTGSSTPQDNIVAPRTDLPQNQINQPLTTSREAGSESNQDAPTDELVMRRQGLEGTPPINVSEAPLTRRGSLPPSWAPTTTQAQINSDSIRARRDVIMRNFATQREAANAAFTAADQTEYVVAPATEARAQALIQLGNLTGENPVQLATARLADLDNPLASRDECIELMERLRDACKDGQLQEQSNLIYAKVLSNYFARPSAYTDRQLGHDNLVQTGPERHERQGFQYPHAPAERSREVAANLGADVRRSVANNRSTSHVSLYALATNENNQGRGNTARSPGTLMQTLHIMPGEVNELERARFVTNENVGSET